MTGPNPKKSWERRPGGMWVLRDKHNAAGRQAVTGVDVLFGTDAVDPRPQWELMQLPLQLNALVRGASRATKRTARPGEAKP